MSGSYSFKPNTKGDVDSAPRKLMADSHRKYKILRWLQSLQHCPAKGVIAQTLLPWRDQQVAKTACQHSQTLGVSVLSGYFMKKILKTKPKTYHWRDRVSSLWTQTNYIVIVLRCVSDGMWMRRGRVCRITEGGICKWRTLVGLCSSGTDWSVFLEKYCQANC